MKLIFRDEMTKLYGLSYLCWPIYFRLRSLMDFKTGIVGEKYPISLNALADACRVEEGQGRRGTGRPSVSKIRTALANLVKAGLLESKSIVAPEQKKLIFFLPIAFATLCHQNKLHSFSTHKARTKDDVDISDQNQDNPTSYEATTKKESTQIRTDSPETFHTDQYNNINIKTNTHTGEAVDNLSGSPLNPKENAFPTTSQKSSPPAHFQPSPQLLHQADALGLVHANDPKTLHEFLSHAKAHGLRYHDWDAAFLTWLIRGERLRQTKPKEGLHAKPTSTSQNTDSLVDKVRHQSATSKTSRVVFLNAHHATGHPNPVGEHDGGLWS